LLMIRLESGWLVRENVDVWLMERSWDGRDL
jgi:hypothetical protein